MPKKTLTKQRHMPKKTTTWPRFNIFCISCIGFVLAFPCLFLVFVCFLHLFICCLSCIDNIVVTILSEWCGSRDWTKEQKACFGEWTNLDKLDDSLVIKCAKNSCWSLAFWLNLRFFTLYWHLFCMIVLDGRCSTRLKFSLWLGHHCLLTFVEHHLTFGKCQFHLLCTSLIPGF